MNAIILKEIHPATRNRVQITEYAQAGLCGTQLRRLEQLIS